MDFLRNHSPKRIQKTGYLQVRYSILLPWSLYRDSPYRLKRLPITNHTILSYLADPNLDAYTCGGADSIIGIICGNFFHKISQENKFVIVVLFFFDYHGIRSHCSGRQWPQSKSMATQKLGHSKFPIEEETWKTCNLTSPWPRSNY